MIRKKWDEALNADQLRVLRDSDTEHPGSSSLNFEKTPIIEGKLTGIKGQYLFIDNNTVLNIRKFTGYSLNCLI